MEKILALLKSLKFLEALCFVAAALLVRFVPQYAVEGSILLAAVVAVLKLFGIQPEMEMKAMLKATEVKNVKLTVKAKAVKK